MGKSISFFEGQSPPEKSGDGMELPHCDRKRMPVPISPVIHGALRAIYAGGPKSVWESDSYGRPLYRYRTRSGCITFFCAPPPDFENRFHPSIAIYYTPRLGFVYAGGLRQAVLNLSVETADIFLILMSRIARLDDPVKGTARISLKEMADLRDVRLRRGSATVLHDVFRREILRLADLRLSMFWKDYKSGGVITFGKDRPDRLLDILDIEYRRGRESWTAFRFRCGHALSHYLNPEGLFWLGYYSRSLLQLSPWHEAFTKKLGTYWILVGTVAEKKGSLPRATPKTILDFCGESVHGIHPGRTVDAFIESHQKLVELGVIDAVPVLEPLARSRGYFSEWLDTPLSVKLSDNLWRIARRKKDIPALTAASGPGRKKAERNAPATRIPLSADELIGNPSMIRKFRSEYYFRQEELARALGITRQTLSGYERGLHPLPQETASGIIRIWINKIRQ